MEFTIAAVQANFIETPFFMYLVIYVISILLFLALRGFNCWYWKINERIALQQETNELLKELIKENIQVEPPKTILEDDYARLFMMEN
jgi:hypothetical protein